MKKISFANVLFWILWVFLFLISALVLIGEFYFSRLFLLALLVFLPVLLRKKLFKRILLSLPLWLGIFLFFVVIVVVTDKTGNDQNLKGMTVVKQEGVTLTLLEGTIPENEKAIIKKDGKAMLPGEGSIMFESYDISLSEGCELAGVAEIVIPYDAKQISKGISHEKALSAAYYNEDENSWEAVPFSVDKSKKTITIFTDHFSKYAVVYYKDGRKTLGDKVPEFDGFTDDFYTDKELLKFTNELGEGVDLLTTPLEVGWNRFGEYYGLTGAMGTLLEQSLESKTLTNVNNLMTEVGAGFALTQLAWDIYKGDNQAAANNFFKNAASYGVSKFGNEAMNLASAGVTFIDLSLNMLAQNTLDKNLQKWEEAYNQFYKNNPNVRRSSVDWYNIVKVLHAQSSDPEDFKKKLDSEITDYTKLFWKDPNAEEYIKNITGYYGLGVSEISDNFKVAIYKQNIENVMNVYMKNQYLEQYRKAERKSRQLKALLNKIYTVSVELDNFDKIENPSKAAVRFVNKDGKVIHSQSFDSNGKAELNITMFAFLKAGGPFTAQIKVSAHGKSEEFNASIPFKLSEENVLLKATYDPGESKEEEEITTAEQSTEETVKETSTATQNKEETKTTRRADETQKPQTTKVPKPEYDYQAALSKWVADYTAEWKRTHEPDVTDSYTQTYEFEWVVYPTIRGNEVVGAHRVWSEKTFHGPMAGQPPVRWISSEFCDAERPCRYLYLGELKNMYPQFGS